MTLIHGLINNLEELEQFIHDVKQSSEKIAPYTIYISELDIRFVEEKLSDGSKVYNLIVKVNQ